MFKLAVFATNNGTDLQSIIDEIKEGNMPGIKIELVFSNKENSFALERSKNQGIETLYLDPKAYTTREDYDSELTKILLEKKIDLIVLAGYTKILTSKITKAFPKKIINVHPSLIPKFSGKGFYGNKVHQAVIDAGEDYSGMTIHYVDEGVDTGEIILQKECKISVDETVETLKNKVQELEKKWFPFVIKNIASS
mgnify:CR=1 FL=1